TNIMSTPVKNDQSPLSSPNPKVTISETQGIEQESAAIVADAVLITIVHPPSIKVKKSKKKEKKGEASSPSSVKKSNGKKSKSKSKSSTESKKVHSMASLYL
ncbi:hypothetical protein A2U01_0071283, partial [Trifolium medium]|nr:hypothetical protein [Trifolium medium]